MPVTINDWPMAHEYDEALLNRRNCFDDFDIQDGILKLISPGQPMRLNGGGSQHVCVYQVGDWVVRCFASDPPTNVYPPMDILSRYQSITAYIRQQANNVPFLVPCYLIEPGVTIKGSRFPYLKLPYVPKSRPLGDFLSEYYEDRQMIRLLAQKWLELIQHMEDLQVAHGDLDLSNVLVSGDSPSLLLYLIDFDGMYLPDFTHMHMGMTDHGHTHFQPAQPDIRRFDPTMDRFSSLVIYLSLCALEQNPELWDKCEASDRNLLLHDEDFQRLAQSTRFPLLRNEHQNKTLQLCLKELQEAIEQKKMPRSLKEILRVAKPLVGGEYIYRPIEANSGSYIGRSLEIPLDVVPTIASTQGSHALSSTSQKTSHGYPPLPTPTTHFAGTPPRKRKRRKIIALIIIIIIIAAISLLIWLSVAHSQQQQSSIIVWLQTLPEPDLLLARNN